MPMVTIGGVRVKRLKEFPNYLVGEDGSVWSTMDNHYQTRNRPKLLKAQPARGYWQVSLSKGGKQHYRKVHHLVLEAFVGPRPGGPEIEGCHGDRNRDNNHLGNLRWDTKAGNYNDRRLHGTDTAGERNGRAKLTDSDVVEILELLAEGWTQKRVADKFGVSQVKVSSIKLGKSWKHVSRGAAACP